MSKQRDALRRGIRDLLQDTSRDLVAFEGREPRPRPAVPPAPEPEAPAPPRRGPSESGGAAYDAPSPNGGPVDAVAEGAAARAEPTVVAPRHQDERLHVEEASAEARREEPAAEASSPPAAAPGPRPPLELTLPAAFSRPVLSGRIKSKPRRGESAGERPRSKSGAKKSKPPRAHRAPVPVRGGPAVPADDLVTEDVGPAPTESRTGVCRSYFVNHECWRVPAAYCNTALQVCVIRNCPVYHLHKDALERRFAKKFKHFW